jgi:hypothetical protein
MSDRWRYWDCLMFGLAASLTLWRDLSILEVAMLLVVLAGVLAGAE